ncbi:hypothetical protein KC960_04440 [Candidatus Saccharibacteria bacterium]|nr:hypothetical protein [Candidatus Saccharibacteria bacterium]
MGYIKKIVINKEDVIPYIYFVCSMARRGKMYGGLSGKSDYIGGIFDRWINIIPESVIFNKYFLPLINKDLTVISDYYEYDPKKSGIAPDVLGIKIGPNAVPFVEYDNRWNAIKGAPQIEVKSFKNTQYMVSLRNQGYDNKYLVMVETSLDTDYLLPFFEQTVLSENTYNRLKMDDAVFIKSNTDNNLSSVTKIERENTDLGTLKLITVCKANVFMSFATLCTSKESPLYVKEINETRSVKTNPNTIDFLNLLEINENGLYTWKTNLLDNNPSHKLLNIHVEGIKNIKYVKNSKSSVTILTTGEAIINNNKLNSGKTYIIKFQLLDRSSNRGDEYFMHKSIIQKIPSEENSMLNDIDKYIR